MLFVEGQKVRLVFTGDIGKIIRLEDDVAQVELPDGDIIPCPLENLEPASSSRSNPIKNLDKPQEKYIPLSANTKFPPGVVLAVRFDPDSPKYFELYLVNHSSQEALFSFQLKSKNKQQGKLNAKIGAKQIHSLGGMEFTWLGEGTKALFEFWPVLQNGTGKKIDFALKIKVPQFFENHHIYSEFNENPVKIYPLFSSWVSDKSNLQKESLKAYTEEKIRWRSWEKIADHPEVSAKAEFNLELDLHVKALTPYFDKLGNLEIIKLQIQHFERYMAEAIKIDAERVFIIHGIGKGKLRQEIAVRLQRYPQVKSFVNEYHPRYGWGATEVIFK